MAEEDKPPEWATPDQVNKAIGGRLEAFQKKLDARLAELLDPIVKRFSEVPPEPDKKDAKESPELAAMRKQNEAMQAKFAAMETERNKEREAGIERTKESAVLEALRKAGIDNPALLKGAASIVKPAMIYADGKVLFRRTDSFGGTEDVEPDTAIAEWAKSDEGKSFLPAKAAAGSGTIVPRTRRAGAEPEKMTPNDAYSTLHGAFFGSGS